MAESEGVERPEQSQPEQSEQSEPADGNDRPDRTGPTDDELFAELVAGFDAPVAEGDRSWPEAEDVADLRPQARPRPAVIRPLPMVRAIPPVDPRAWTPEEDPDDEHFTPPEPPPLPQAQAATKLSLLALVVGLVLIALGEIGELPGMATFLGVCSVAGAVVSLVVRMRNPDPEEEDDDPNHGAVV